MITGRITKAHIAAALSDCGGSGTTADIHAAFCKREGEVTRHKMSMALLTLFRRGHLTRPAPAVYALPGVSVTVTTPLRQRLAAAFDAADGPISLWALSAAIGTDVRALYGTVRRMRSVRRIAKGWYAKEGTALDGWCPPPTPKKPRKSRAGPNPRLRLPRLQADAPLAGLVHEFLAVLKTRDFSPVTITTYGYRLPTLLAGLTTVKDMTADNLSAAMLRFAGRKPRYRASLRGVLLSFCKWLVERGLLAENPTRKLPAPKLDPVPFHALDEQQVRAVFDTCRDDTERLVVRLLLTGLRAAELLSLRWQDVDAAHRTIRVTHGKGEKSRQVPAETATLVALAAYPHASERIIDWKYARLKRHLNEIGRAAGLPWRLNAHDFRRTTAALWIGQGGDIGALQMILGHANVDQTLYYGRGVREDSAVQRGLEMGLAGRLLDTPASARETTSAQTFLASEDSPPGDDMAEALCYLADPRIRAALLALGRAMKGGDRASA